MTVAAPGTEPVLSIVVPVYNEAGSLPELRARLEAAVTRIGLPAEFVFIDDGSTDGAWDALAAWHREDPRVRAVRFSRNFGKEAALSAGLELARGQAVVLIDGDLQNPPEAIVEFVARWREGYDMVYGLRRQRDSDSMLRRRVSLAFYRTFARMADVTLPQGAGDFRLLDRRVVDALNRMPERVRFMKGLYAWVGFRHTGVPYDHPARRHGRSAWSYRRLTRFGFDGIAAFSRVPLVVSGWLGAIMAGLALVYGSYLALRTLVHGVDVPGYASTFVAVVILGGLQLLGIGLLGAYVGRMYEETKRRPLYVVDDVLDAGGGRAAPRPRALADAAPRG